jgi:hypothetical protein
MAALQEIRSREGRSMETYLLTFLDVLEDILL